MLAPNNRTVDPRGHDEVVPILRNRFFTPRVARYWVSAGGDVYCARFVEFKELCYEALALLGDKVFVQ